MSATKSWNDLVTAVLGLPGVGPKMGERIALHLLRNQDTADSLIEKIQSAKQRLKRCHLCGDFIETEDISPPPCHKCLDPGRDAQLLCVVEEIGDLYALERSHAFHGRYHVLGGVLSALDGIGPEDLRINILLDRIKKENMREVILATNPTTEGETTASYLADLLQSHDIPVTRLAYGLSSGSMIQYADEYTLAKALEGRKTY